MSKRPRPRQTEVDIKTCYIIPVPGSGESYPRYSGKHEAFQYRRQDNLPWGLELKYQDLDSGLDLIKLPFVGLSPKTCELSLGFEHWVVRYPHSGGWMFDAYQDQEFRAWFKLRAPGTWKPWKVLEPSGDEVVVDLGYMGDRGEADVLWEWGQRLRQTR